MRILSFLFLAAAVAVVVIFAMQNDADVTLRFFDFSVNTTVAIMVGAVYVLGMFTGWAVIGMFRRSLERVTEEPHRREQVYTR